MTGPIDTYLDELVSRLSTRRPRQLRSLLAEAEAHLRDDAGAGVAAGLTQHAAETNAVTRFGPVEEIAIAERATWRAPAAVVAKQFVGSAALLGGTAAITIGISGLTALIVRAVSGAKVLVDPPTAAVLTPSNCARWLGTRTASPGPACRSAAIRDWVSEVIGYRLGAGVLGVILVVALVMLKRRRGTIPALPPLVTNSIAAVAFAAAGSWLLAAGIDSIVISHGDGAGQWLSAAPVALVAAGVYGLRLIRDVQHVTLDTR